MLPPDYHTHTSLCKHAEGDVSEYVKSAREKQLPEICCTDHAPASNGYDPLNRMEIGQFPFYAESVSSLQNPDYPVLFGIEADYYEGCEEFLRNWLIEQKFDLVIGSIHYIGRWGFDNPNEISMWNSVDITETWRKYFKLVAKLADTGMYDILTHPDLPKKFGDKPSDADIKEMIQPALDRISSAGMGIEINTSGLRKPVKEMYPSPLFLELAKEREIPICFGSDAHLPEEVGYAFDEAVTLARSVGYTHYLKFKQRQKKLIPLPEVTNSRP